MALFTPILGNISGKIAGNVFSHNRGGAYIRNGPAVTNPNTIYQQAVRAIMGDLVSAWNDSLTPAQRAAWETYAENVAMTNRIGETIHLTGQNQFVRSNVPRLQIDTTRIDTAPVLYNLGETGVFTFAATSEPDSPDLSIGFDQTQEWVDEDLSFLIVQGSRPQMETINFFKGPFRLAGSVEGDSVTPPTSPATIVGAFPYFAGHRMYARVRVSRADGRLSAPQIVNTVVVS